MRLLAYKDHSSPIHLHTMLCENRFRISCRCTQASRAVRLHRSFNVSDEFQAQIILAGAYTPKCALERNKKRRPQPPFCNRISRPAYWARSDIRPAATASRETVRSPPSVKATMRFCTCSMRAPSAANQAAAGSLSLAKRLSAAMVMPRAACVIVSLARDSASPS